MKKCTKCGEVKKLEGFAKNRELKDGFHSWCKECGKEYAKERYKRNRAEIRAKQKEYYERNKEVIRAQDKKRYERNKDEILKQQKEYRARNKEAIRAQDKKRYERNIEARHAQKREYSKSIASDTFLDRLPPNYKARAPLGVLEVKCKTCGKYFIPSVMAVNHCIMSYEGKMRGENNLYCSDGCKEACPVYRFDPTRHVDPRSDLFKGKEERDEVRQCQTDHLKQLQCDQYGYNFCEKCGDIGDVHLHHTLPVSEFGQQAINSSGHLLLCAGCHVELHSECSREVEHA